MANPRARPPSSALIEAVMTHADLKDQMGGGRVLLRVSPEAEEAADLGYLGIEKSQIREVAILFDEVEDQIIRVMDGRGAPSA